MLTEKKNLKLNGTDKLEYITEWEEDKQDYMKD
jgi:hypothetical protein